MYISISFHNALLNCTIMHLFIYPIFFLIYLLYDFIIIYSKYYTENFDPNT